MLKLVLDTNTCISGLLWNGNEAKLIRKVESGEAYSFTSKEILEEIDVVIRRCRFEKNLNIAKTTANEVLSKIGNLSTTVIGPKLEENVVKEDKSDDKFIECALNAKADIIVTGDEHLLKVKECRNIKIMTTADVLKLLKNQALP